jgi:hypothetical protein
VIGVTDLRQSAMFVGGNFLISYYQITILPPGIRPLLSEPSKIFADPMNPPTKLLKLLQRLKCILDTASMGKFNLITQFVSRFPWMVSTQVLQTISSIREI